MGLRAALLALGVASQLASLGWASASAPPTIEAPPARVEVRDGLGNVEAKLGAGETVTIAYVGGSITELPGWRDGFDRRLRERFGEGAVREVNAGLSGTGSAVAAFRLDGEVLQHDPDLVVIEFAVNDANTGRRAVRRAVEGMVRKIWAKDPATDVLFVYLYEPGYDRARARGVRPGSIVAHEEVAAHYGIPSIDAASVVSRLLEEGAIRRQGPAKTTVGTPPAFSSDGLHPHRLGHEIYEEAVYDGWMRILARSEPGDHRGALGKPPLAADHWQEARRVPLSAVLGEGARDGGWRPARDGEAPNVTARGIELWQAEEAGAEIEFGFRGRILKIYELRDVGPDVPEMEVRIDGQVLPSEAYRPLRPGARLRVLHLRAPFDPKKERRVSIRAVASPGGGAPLRLGDLLVLGEVVPVPAGGEVAP